jgi:hypothetical protein
MELIMIPHRSAWTVLLALCVGCLASEFAVAQPVAIDGAVGSTLVARLRWVQFDIVGGRLVATPLHIGSNINTSTSINHRRENLSIDLSNPAPNIRYELTATDEELRIEVRDGDQFLLQRVRKIDDAPVKVELSQAAANEPIKLTIERGNQSHLYERATVWQLLLEDRQVTAELLSPLFELMRPGWKLAGLMDTVERALCEEARYRRGNNEDLWAKAVAGLASSHYPVRTAAERELLAVGREVLPYLRSLDRQSLDAEQRRRIRFVIDSLDTSEGDSLEQIVSLLSSDRATWLTLMKRPELAKRKLAYEQLVRLEGPSVEFDPAANESVRAAQIDALQARFSRE